MKRILLLTPLFHLLASAAVLHGGKDFPSFITGTIEPDVTMENRADPSATLTTILYGPYNVSSMDMFDEFEHNVPKPCSDCYITAMQADLQYPGGRTANIDTGAWLHHIVLINGWETGKVDLTCAEDEKRRERNRIFASGNERTAIRINSSGKYGLVVSEGDDFHLLSDLVNQSDQEQSYYVAITYEWVPKTNKAYKEARMIWMDIAGCADSEATAQEGVYELKSPGWISTVSGQMLTTLGHTHDGGTHTTLYDGGYAICVSEQLYGTKEEFIESSDIENLSGDVNSAHISEVSTCNQLPRLEIGDELVVGASYNTTAHALNKASGNDHGSEHAMNGFAPIMGINLVYIAVD